ncbi:MAG: LamG-like jellyroll fold domain-containing protein, partial [Verrucomicrobiota bacterium]
GAFVLFNAQAGDTIDIAHSSFGLSHLSDDGSDSSQLSARIYSIGDVVECGADTSPVPPVPGASNPTDRIIDGDCPDGNTVQTIERTWETPGGTNCVELITVVDTTPPDLVCPDLADCLNAGAQPGLLYGLLPGNVNETDPNPGTSVSLDLSQANDTSLPGNSTEVYSGEIFDADGNISFWENNDDKTRLWVAGSLVLNNDSWNTVTTTPDLNLTPGWNSFELRMSNGGGAGGSVASAGFAFQIDPDGGTDWERIQDTPGLGEQILRHQVTIECDLQADIVAAINNGSLTKCVGDEPGFNVRVYDTVFGAGNLNPIANLLNNTNFTTDVYDNPIFDYANGAALQADYPGLTANDTFSLAWEGIVQVLPTDSLDWSFGTASDDGSMVYIDLNDDGDFADAGELIVDNNGNHGRREIIGDVSFPDAGCYNIVIAMYEQSGGENMEAKFSKLPGQSYAAQSFIDGTTGPFYRSGSLQAIGATATDNCDTDVMVTVTNNLLDGNPCSVTVTVTYIAIDDCGNETNCSQDLVFVDSTPPTVDEQRTIVVECNAEGGYIDDDTVQDFVDDLVESGSDNCDPNPEIEADDLPGLFAIGNCNGSINIPIEVSDQCGNEDTINLIVQVRDTTAPTIDCPDNVTIECDEDSSPAGTGTATASDICDPAPGVTFTDETCAGECPAIAVITRTWTATDNCGNSVSCQQTITLVDTSAPELVGVGADATIECGDPIPAKTAVTAVDNCESVEVALPVTANMILHLDAGSLALDDGDPVAAWGDQSGNGNDVSQANAGQEPSFVECAQNLRPAVRFDGANDWLTARPWNNPADAEWDIFLVLKRNTLKNSSAFWFSYPPDGGGQRVQAHLPWGNGTVFWDSGGCCGGAQRISVGGLVTDQWASWNFLSSVSNNVKEIYRNGSLAGSSAGASTAGPLSGLDLGREFNRGNYWSGDLAEMIVYNRTLSAADRAAVEAYFQAKYFDANNIPRPAVTVTCQTNVIAGACEGEQVIDYVYTTELYILTERISGKYSCVFSVRHCG